MLVEQMGSGEGAAMGPMGPQHHLHNLLEVSANATNTHTHTGTLSCHSVSGAFICGVGLWPLLLPLTPLPPQLNLTPRDHWRGKTTVARACCVTPRGVGQLWLVYCQQSHWGPGAQGQSEFWPLLDSSTFKAQGTSQHGEWKGGKKKIIIKIEINCPPTITTTAVHLLC